MFYKSLYINIQPWHAMAIYNLKHPEMLDFSGIVAPTNHYSSEVAT